MSDRFSHTYINRLEGAAQEAEETDDQGQREWAVKELAKVAKDLVSAVNRHERAVAAANAERDLLRAIITEQMRGER